MIATLFVVAIAVDSDDARACGPDFPPDLLSDRAMTLKRLPDGPFVDGARHLVDDLVSPDPPVKPVWREPASARSTGGVRERALYDDGARAFHAGSLDVARTAFAALLALPENERKGRSTWAAFMLGRLGDIDAFADVRALAAAGFDDALGLAAASYGEEARAFLPAGASSWVTGADVSARRPDLDRALLLYARQARAGDDNGAVSLLEVIRSYVRTADDADGTVADIVKRAEPLVSSRVGRRLIALYASTRPTEHVRGLRPLLETVAARIDREWPDHLAAGLYHQGQVTQAAALIGRHDVATDTPLATWVKAKIALAEGRVDDAHALLILAADRFPPAAPRGEPVWLSDEDEWTAVSPAARTRGEAAVLSLGRHEYVRALDELVRTNAWWQDVAWVAERVLTLDELRRYVDVKMAAPAPSATLVDAADHDDEEHSGWNPGDQRLALRNLLARRLMRAGHTAAAVNYFDDHGDRAAAADLADRFARVQALDDVDRAAALYAIGRRVRRSGFRLYATELAPDYRIWMGNFAPFEEADQALNKGALDDEEEARARAHLPIPARRFHYRTLAAQHLEEAARLVPSRSQAYAALLCQATHDLHRDRASVERLWRTYVRYGAIVDFTSAFGSLEVPCPPPDFDAAKTFRMPASTRPPTLVPRKRTIALATFVVLGAVFAGALVMRTRGTRERRDGDTRASGG
jgi:hypothetical protein